MVEVPDPKLLEIHPTFLKVLHLCGASEYLERHEIQVTGEMASITSDELDLVTLSAHVAGTVGLLISFGTVTVAMTTTHDLVSYPVPFYHEGTNM
jgi:hypothetical protein